MSKNDKDPNSAQLRTSGNGKVLKHYHKINPKIKKQLLIYILYVC